MKAEFYCFLFCSDPLLTGMSGFYYITGIMDGKIPRNGFKVALGEVQKAVQQLPGPYVPSIAQDIFCHQFGLCQLIFGKNPGER